MEGESLTNLRDQILLPLLYSQNLVRLSVDPLWLIADGYLCFYCILCDHLVYEHTLLLAKPIHSIDRLRPFSIVAQRYLSVHLGFDRLLQAITLSALIEPK